MGAVQSMQQSRLKLYKKMQQNRIETAHMIRKGQFGANGRYAFQQFATLAA